MKILKTYVNEEAKYMEYGTDSPLLKALRSRFEIDEVVLPEEYTEHEYAELIRKYDVLLTMWKSVHVPNELARDPGNLKYICNITGTMHWIDREIIESPYITVTNWGDAPAYGIAEASFALLLATMKNIPYYLTAVRQAKTRADVCELPTQAQLYHMRIGVYGVGAIGRKFIEFLQPFQPYVYAYDPFAKNIPEGVTMVESLDELFEISQIIVVHAALTDATKGSVTAELLAKLPDGGIVINTARGDIIDYKALQAELISGRLRAGLDVVGEYNLPEVNDPIRHLDNVILTSHHLGASGWGHNPEALNIAATICVENLERFRKGAPLKFIMTPERYDLSS